MATPSESAVLPSEFRPSKEGSDSADACTVRNRPNRTDSEIRTASDKPLETSSETASV